MTFAETRVLLVNLLRKIGELGKKNAIDVKQKTYLKTWTIMQDPRLLDVSFEFEQSRDDARFEIDLISLAIESTKQ